MRRTVGRPPQLVGRVGELATLEVALDDARSGAGAVVLVGGEAGIGKTYLLGLARERARDRGMQVLAGACELLERSRSFAPFEHALGPVVPAAVDSEGVGRAGSSGAGRFLVQEAIIDHLEQRAANGPVLVTIDDLQWADEPSLGTLAALSRRVGDLPMAILGAHRPTPALPGRVVEVIAESGGRLMTLDPLGSPEVIALVTAAVGAPPGEGLRALVDGAGGNPFLVLELVRALGDEKAIAVEDGAAETTFRGLPPPLRQTVLRRVRGLSPGVLDLLRAAAVLGGSFELDDVAGVLERSPVSLHADVFASLDAGLLEEHGTQLRFRHDLIREAIYEHTPQAIRASLHQQAARVLERRAAPAAMVAGHLALAPGGADARSLRRAAAELADSDPDGAVHMLDRALALLDLDDGERAEALSERVSLLAAAGRLVEGEAAARAALATDLPAGLRIRIELTLAENLLLGGNAAAAVAVLEEAAESDLETSGVRSRLLADMAWARLVGLDIEGADRDAAAAVVAAEQQDDPLALTVGLAVQCRLAAFAVDFDRAIDLGRRAVATSAAGGAAAVHRTPHYYLGLALLNGDRVDEAIDVLREGRRIAEAAGLAPAAAMYHTGLVTSGFHSGRWDDATAEAEAARLLHADTGVRRGVMQMESMLGLMWFHQGEERLARDALARAEADLAVPGHDVGGILWLLWLRAAFAEAEGDVATAARLLGRMFDLTTETGIASVKLWFGPEAVRLSLAAGDDERASSSATDVVAVAARAGTATAAGAAACCTGMVQRDPEHLTAAVAAYRQAPRRFDLARACVVLGEQLAAMGRTDEAVNSLQEAIVVLDELRANREIRRVNGRLRRLGMRHGAHGRRGRPTTGPDSLTPTERQVLRLVGEGLSNREIAERLYVSRRTIETHVGHLYTKLGVRGRVALARLTLDD